MKKLVSIMIFLITCIFSFGNDWEFISQGEHLIPLQISDMAIKKEKIEFNLRDDRFMDVSVNFVFDSSSAGSRTIGFITPPDEYNDADNAPSGTGYDSESIKNFKTVVNGKKVRIRIGKMDEFLNKGFFTAEEEKEYKNKYSKASVYYFKADLKKGENTINHSYSYRGATSTYDKGEYQYVLTTISKWKNKKVDDFEIIVNMKKNELFSLPYTFWNDGKPIKWEIVGNGDIVFLDKSKLEEGYSEIVYAKLKSGYVRYKTKNFAPDKEFYSHIPMNRYISSVKSDIKINGYKFRDPLEDEIGTNLALKGWSEGDKAIKELDKLSTFQLEVLRNYPFAQYGHEFTRKDLRNYFSQFFWYEPNKKVYVPEYTYEARIKIIDEILKKRKK